MAYDFSTQFETLKVIARFIDKHGYSPTVDEIAIRRDLHRTAINKQLVQLVNQGYIRRVGGWRNIRIVRMPS